jgi:hypothetical protein
MKVLGCCLALALLLCASTPAAAHLMVAQKGTLNLQGDGAFLVLSLPVSAFADTSEPQVVQQVELKAWAASRRSPTSGD